MDSHPIQGGVEIFLVASCYGNRDKLRPDGPLGSYADFTYTPKTGNSTLFKFHVLRKGKLKPRVDIETEKAGTWERENRNRSQKWAKTKIKTTANLLVNIGRKSREAPGGVGAR